MSAKHFLSDSEVVSQIIAIFDRVNPESRERLFETLGTYLGVERGRKTTEKRLENSGQESAESLPKFTEDRSLTPKEFVRQKQPRTDVEKVACLAYYLTHYQDTPHFKTIDISRLNTGAAQIKFSNPADATNNAVKMRYLTQAGGGTRQITALGEQFVEALPDRDAAKAAMSAVRKRRGNKRHKNT